MVVVTVVVLTMVIMQVVMVVITMVVVLVILPKWSCNGCSDEDPCSYQMVLV